MVGRLCRSLQSLFTYKEQTWFFFYVYKSRYFVSVCLFLRWSHWLAWNSLQNRWHWTQRSTCLSQCERKDFPEWSQGCLWVLGTVFELALCVMMEKLVKQLRINFFFSFSCGMFGGRVLVFSPGWAGIGYVTSRAQGWQVWVTLWALLFEVVHVAQTSLKARIVKNDLNHRPSIFTFQALGLEMWTPATAWTRLVLGADSGLLRKQHTRGLGLKDKPPCLLTTTTFSPLWVLGIKPGAWWHETNS